MEDKPRQINYTRELKNAMAAGAVIECAVAPYEGTRVAYRPTNRNDPLPWVCVETPARWEGEALDTYRYSGRECRVRGES